MIAGWNVVDNNSTTSDASTHGTQAAGTAAAATNNGVGSAGICWGCKIMPVRVTDDTYGFATSSNVAALNARLACGDAVVALSRPLEGRHKEKRNKQKARSRI